MADAGTRAADRAQAEMERKMRRIYRQAQQEIIEKLNAHTQRMYALDAQKRAELAAGKITAQQYKSWLLGQQFTQKMWKQKVDSVATTLLTANQQANAIVEGEKRAVFGENATYAAYEMEHGMGRDLSFSVYDSATVTKLLREDPELLPRRVVNGEKDKAWNRKKISAAVTQGIIQGESIQQIAQRIARQTASSNMKAMTRYARTAMTSAQNAGRIEAMHHAQDMGIKVQKKWLATLDNRTRDAHAHLDGQVQDVDKPFQSQLGPIMFPGDPSADPGNVYNCRCALVWVYPEYSSENAKRRDNETGKLIEAMLYSEWKIFKQQPNDDQEWNNAQKQRIESIIGQLEKQLDGWNDKTFSSYAASFSEYTKVEDRINALYKKRAELKYPDDALLPGIKHIDKKLTAREKLAQCNPHFREGRQWQNNCQRTVVAQEFIYRGYDVTAMPFDKDDAIGNSGVACWKFDNAKWFLDSGVRLTKRSEFKKAVEHAFDEWGDGARAIVRVQWTKGNGGNGHFFTVRMENGTIVYEDPQINAKRDIDDTLKKCTTKENALWLMRIDNRSVNDLVTLAVKER
jgi:uncharacterized protein with gpF-like domain